MTATEPAALEDRGGDMWVANTRISIHHIYQYIHNGHGWDTVHAIMTSLTREQFDLAMAYIEENRARLAVEYDQIEARIAREMAEQRIRFPKLYENEHLPAEERRAIMWAKLQKRLAEKSGAGHTG